MEDNGIKQIIIKENISRLKYASLLFVGFTVFAFTLHILKIDFWTAKHPKLFLTLDIIFAVISVFSFLIFWFIKPGNLKTFNLLNKIIIFLVLLWSAVITGIDITVSGFSTYLLILLVCVFFVYLEFYISVTFYLVSYVAVIITAQIMHQINEDIFSLLFTFFPVIIVSVLISRKNFQKRIKSLEDEQKLRELTNELSKTAKEINLRYQTILKNFPNGAIFLFDKNMKYIHVEGKALKEVGLEPGKMIGKTVKEVFPPEVSDIVYPNLLQLFKGKSCSYEVEFAGNIYANWGEPVINHENSINEGVVFTLDITGKKKAEHAIKESEQRLKLASQSAELGIWDWNVKENIMVWDQKMYELYGIKKETFVKTVDAWMNGLHPEDKERAISECNEALKGNINFDTTFRVQHPNGKVLYIKADGLVLRDSNGEATRMIGVNRDVTTSKINEIELKKAKERAEEANRLKTQFLNNMSHEIRTPMNGIIGFSEMLDNPDISDEKRIYYSKIVKNSSHQLLKIIDDILEISTLETRQEKLYETEFCLNDLLMKLFSSFNIKSKEKNIALYLKKALQDQQSYMILDKTKLNKILSNLLENALKFTSEGFIEFGYYLQETTLILYVKDTGIGISPQNLDKIFERFAQEDKDISGKYGGLGLGLSISKENARLLGGDITLVSEKGKGSTFIVTIPHTPVQKDHAGSAEKSSDHTAKNNEYTILVAEDEEINYLYIETLFNEGIEGNYRLIRAKDGKEALDICLENKKIDIVLMDIKMPVMNGLEATERIKTKYPNLPVIAQTAYSTESDKRLALEHGCNDFISKPINKEKLFALIQKYLLV